ncbi:MAG: exodeoxyribonuclease V subunit gamma, partial [Anaerolineaceae bacterium]|nr:exodeoxyribonuclease V subunit gamma [Anaerolineaceae bacterium]
MPIELLIAPAASGKTELCINRLRATQQENPLTQVWALVPNTQAAAQFRSRLAASGGGMGVKIGFFHHFYQDILEENGRFVPVISQALSHRLIQETVREVSASGNLRHYDAIKDKPGFFSVLKDSFAELRSTLVTPEALLDYTRGSTPARQELAILYERFLARLGTLGWIDSEGQAWLAIEALENNSAIASHESLVVVDGFTAFTAAQRRFLKLLGQQADEMIITLTGEPESTRMVHRRAQKVLQGLETELSPKIVTINHPALLATPILQMEKSVLNPEAVEQCELQEPILLEARSQSEEAREALRWVKQLHVRQNVPLSKCAIYTADLSTYQPLLRAAADEFGLNLRFSQRDPLVESPAILSMLNLLTLPLENYPTRALLNALHSPYFQFGLESQDVENLEKVSQQAIIVTGKDQWDAAWIMLARKHQDYAEALDDERYRPDLTAGIDLPGLKQRLDGFWNLFTQIEITRSEAGWVEWLEALLSTLSFYENISTERDRAACSSLGEALRALVVSEKVVGVREVDYSQFVTDLQSALNGANLEEPTEARKNAVFIGKLVEARGSRYQAVALLGFSEGLFPIVENPDPFLDEELRKDLGLEPRLQREQASTF